MSVDEGILIGCHHRCNKNLYFFERTILFPTPSLQTAYGNDRTPCAFQQVTLSGAVARNTQMTQRKVIPQGIIAVKLAKPLGDVDGQPQSRRLHVRQSG